MLSSAQIRVSQDENEGYSMPQRLEKIILILISILRFFSSVMSFVQIYLYNVIRVLTSGSDVDVLSNVRDFFTHIALTP